MTRVSSSFREATAERTDEFVARGICRRDVVRAPRLPPSQVRARRLPARVADVRGRRSRGDVGARPVRRRRTGSAGSRPSCSSTTTSSGTSSSSACPGQVASANVVMRRRHGLLDGPRVRPRAAHRAQARAQDADREALRRLAAHAPQRDPGFRRRAGARTVRAPKAAFALRHTDRSRDVQPELFERIYDRTVTWLTPARTPRGRLVGDRRCRRRATAWSAASGARSSAARPSGSSASTTTPSAAWSRRRRPEFARRADRHAPAALDAMLGDRGARRRPRATYCVRGGVSRRGARPDRGGRPQRRVSLVRPPHRP